MANKIRLTLDVTDKVYQNITKLQDDMGASSKAEVLRDALRLLRYVVDCKKEGSTIIVRRKTGEDKELIILI